MKTNLFYKVFITYLVIVALAMAIVGLLAHKQLRTTMMARIERELTSYTSLINLTYQVQDMEEKVRQLARIADARVTLIAAQGSVLADSEAAAAEMDNHLNRTEIQEARVKGRGSAIRYSRTMGIDTLYVALPIESESTISGYIRLSRPLFEIKASINKMISLILQSFVLIGVISFIIAFIFTSRLVSPVQEMEEYTRKLRDEEYPPAILVSSNDERGRLADNINYLVSELREKVRLAREERCTLEAAFASMNDGVLIINSENRIESLNNAFKGIFGARFRDIIGRTSLEAFRNIELQNAIEQFKESGTPISREITLDIENGLSLDVHISSILGLPKDEDKTMIVFHDVTRMKKLEKMRVDFVANVTHEIKTPLSAILGFVETLQDGAIDDRKTAHTFMDTIQKHAERLNRLVDDLLTISNLELGQTKLILEAVRVSDVAETVMSILELKAQEKGIVMERDIPEGLAPVKADRDKLSQILLNITENAIKFTPESGKVSIGARDLHNGYVEIAVTDSGIGIPKDEIPRLGERFYRVDKTRSREMGGTGLGLSIVKHLILAHEGTFTIESQPGRGTTVVLSLPSY